MEEFMVAARRREIRLVPLTPAHEAGVAALVQDADVRRTRACPRTPSPN
jgi:hypothetical protein